jgi:hypothetical protein
VRVGGLDRDAHRAGGAGARFQQREQVRRQHHVAHVVQRHVPVYARVLG